MFTVREKIGAIATPDYIQNAPGLPKTRSGNEAALCHVRRVRVPPPRSDMSFSPVADAAADAAVDAAVAPVVTLLKPSSLSPSAGKIMRRLLRKIACDERELGDVSTLADSTVVEQLFQNRCCTAV